MHYTILFESTDFLAVEKPVGISTIFERQKETNCLVQALRESTGIPLLVVHRLDKDVSGVVVFAKHSAAHRSLNLRFDRREVRKTYYAVAHGRFESNRGQIQKPIRQFGSGRMGVDESRGKESTTEYFVEKINNRYTLVRLKPITGRRHQLRVHLYSIGHPIVGDPIYGDRTVQKEYPRLMLHAQRIEFDWNGETLRVESPVPDGFREFFI